MASPPPAAEPASRREETGQEQEQHERHEVAEPAATSAAGPSSPVRRQPSPSLSPSPPTAATAPPAPAPTTAASSTTPASSASSSGSQSPGHAASAPTTQQAEALLSVPARAAATQPPTPLYSPSPKGILKRRRATAPEQQQTSDDPSVYMEGKRLRFRSMGDLGSSDRSAGHSPTPLSPRSSGRPKNAVWGSTTFADDPRRRSSMLTDTATEADAERAVEEDEGQDELGKLPSDPDRARKLVDINQGEELRQSVERLERFCEASVEWSMSLETQGNPAASPAAARMTRKHSAVGSPTSSPRAQSAQPRPFAGPPPLPPSFNAGRRSIALSPKSAASILVQPAMPHRAQSDPHTTAQLGFTDARRQSLPERLHSAAASLVVIACQPQSRSKSFSHGRNSISASSNVLPPLSAPPSPPRTTTILPDGRRPSLAPKLPSFQDVVNNEGGGAAQATSNANQLLNKFRRLSQPVVNGASAAAAATAAAATASANGARAPTNSASLSASPRPTTSEPPTDGSGLQAPLSARNLVQTYSSVLRDRLQSWEGLENLVKDAEAVADDWEETGMGKVELVYGTPPPQSQPAYHQQQQYQQQQQQYTDGYQHRPSA